MDTQLSQGLTFLAWSGSVFLIIIGVFTAKLLFDLSRLASSLNKSAKIVGDELEPIMKNVTEATGTINSIVQSTNKRVGKITEVYDKVSDVAVQAVSKASAVSGFVLKEVFRGIVAGFKAVVKKK